VVIPITKVIEITSSFEKFWFYVLFIYYTVTIYSVLDSFTSLLIDVIICDYVYQRSVCNYEVFRFCLF